MRKRVLVLAILALFAIECRLAVASPVSQEQALRAATNFLKIKGMPDAQLLDITATTDFSNLYIFSERNGNGFIIVSADDCVTPILGYSLTNQFEVEEMPEHVRDWFVSYNEQVAFYSNQQAAATGDSSPAKQWERLLDGETPTPPLTTSVSPLVTTTWNQAPLYNAMCPYDNNEGEYSVTGCVATATAQIMKYWNHPTTGYGSHSYSHSTYGTLSANFGTTTYAWSDMPNALTSSSSTTQINAVAQLMHHIGVAVEMDYSPQSSGAYTVNKYRYWGYASAEDALIHYFKYSPMLHHISLEDYTTALWTAVLINEFDNNRPVLYSGRSSSGGHAFICDGYDNSGLIHLNWGWGGYCDGYYAIGSLNPAPGGIGGNAVSSYNIDNTAIIGIQPNTNFGNSTVVNATSNNNSLGTVSGGGTFTGTNTSTVTLRATAASGCRFTEWSDGYKCNPRTFPANGGTYSFTANFEMLSGDTLGYSDDYNITGLESNSGSSTWGIKLPASILERGRMLSAVQFYNRNSGTYDITIYTGTSSPSTNAASQSYTTSTAGQWSTVTLTTPVDVVDGESIWISLSSAGSYPASMSHNSGNPDGLLWGSTLSPISYDFTFMIKGIFTESDNQPLYDTIYVYDTITIHDTIIVNHYIHDTTYVTDTLYVDNYIYDTTYIVDTLYVDNYIHDTIYTTDTMYVDNYIHDTIYATDTMYVDNYIHDTIYATDTMYVDNYIYDTTYVTDTMYVDNYIYDTTYVTDTLWMYDTIYVHDTIYVYDTIVTGTDDIVTLNLKMYTQGNEIVIEGAENNAVYLYDAIGRRLDYKPASAGTSSSAIRFHVPVSGTYLVKVGNYPARRIVVIR